MKPCACTRMPLSGQQAEELRTSGHRAIDMTWALLQVIVDDYVQSEAVLKASRMHHELDLDGVPSSGPDMPLPTEQACWETLCCVHRQAARRSAILDAACKPSCTARMGKARTSDLGSCAVYLTGNQVIAATRDTMEDTIAFINDKYGSARRYLKAVSPLRRALCAACPCCSTCLPPTAVHGRLRPASSSSSALASGQCLAVHWLLLRTALPESRPRGG